MKPKSKKDLYTVECENKEQTIKVLNYIHGDNDQRWGHWNFVTNSQSESSINEINVYNYPVISFEDWENLPDEEFVLPKHWCINGCEELSQYFKEIGVINLSSTYDDQFYYITYDGKWDCKLSKDNSTVITFDQFKEHVLSEIKETVNISVLNHDTEKYETIAHYENWKKPKYFKEIIGYKLIKEEYKEAAQYIAFNENRPFTHLLNGKIDFYCDSIVHERINHAGVMHWFEPVYQLSTEENIMDYLAKKGTKLTKEEAEDIVKLVNEK